MKNEQNRQPAGIPEGGRFAGHIHAEADSLNSNHAEPQRGPVFTEEELASTPKGQYVKRARQRLDELGKNPVRNFLDIRKAREALRLREIDFDYGVMRLAAKNEEWHRAHPEAPAWAFPNEVFMDGLYKHLRGFDVVAEGLPRSYGHMSPGLPSAKNSLHYSQLSASDQEALSRYFHKHDWHDCKDHTSEWSTYWKVQDELDRIAMSVPPMSQPVTVWRGESYGASEGSDFDGSSARKLARMEYLMSLQPGQRFQWDNCAATSLSLDVAANKFSGSRRPEDFKHVSQQHRGQNVSHSVLFELETDRGVFIDSGLTNANHSNENEILLPREMDFEVVGHAQLRAEHVNRNNLSGAYHLIKLKLGTS